MVEKNIKFNLNTVYHGDAKQVLPYFPDKSVNLIITSPPYSNKRKKAYGGIPPGQYVDWFSDISLNLYRILKDDGSFILNIKEGANGEKDTYVLELILALRKHGWLWTEEYIWRKTTSMPGKWPNRFRDGWERCLHFTKSHKFKMYQNRVMLPIGDWSKIRMKNLSENDKKRRWSSSGSGLSRNLLNWAGRTKVYPDNVLEFAPVCKNNYHSAVFPEELPTWFIKLLTSKNDVVLDPFIGSGTTAIASIKNGRKYLGIEKYFKYYNLAVNNINSVPTTHAKSSSDIL